MVLKTRFSKKVVQAATQKSSSINVTTDWLIAQATGYLQLAMLDEAERLLNQVPEREAKPHLAAQNTPLKIYVSRIQSERAADTGTRLILEGAYNVQTIILTMCTLTFIGRHKEGRQVLQLVEQFDRPVSAHAYQMAYFDALTGNYPDALR